VEFKQLFDTFSQDSGLKQFLTYYFIAAHPGCGDLEMQRLKRFTGRALRMTPEQVQIFTPTPSTYSSLMYYAGLDPFTLEPVFVEKDPARKERQKRILLERTDPLPARAGKNASGHPSTGPRRPAPRKG
jgi:radical SAM superfamily enzyme YgiQ (UPF0313 family)